MLLDLGGADVGAAANDHVLDPALQAQQALVAELAAVAGVVPALAVDRDRGALRVAPVAEHGAGPAVADLALLARRQLLAGLVHHSELDSVERGPAVGDARPH